MSDQTTANQPTAEPVLCKMGCGFFGNGAHGGCCSKCFRDLQKKQGLEVAPAASSKAQTETSDMTVSKQPMEVDEPSQVVFIEEDHANAEAPKKKKKKKASYKALMAGVMQKSSPSRDVEKEKDDLRKVTGGGAFSKVDKI